MLNPQQHSKLLKKKQVLAEMSQLEQQMRLYTINKKLTAIAKLEEVGAVPEDKKDKFATKKDTLEKERSQILLTVM
jgi:competence protein ComGC